MFQDKICENDKQVISILDKLGCVVSECGCQR